MAKEKKKKKETSAVKYNIIPPATTVGGGIIKILAKTIVFTIVMVKPNKKETEGFLMAAQDQAL